VAVLILEKDPFVSDTIPNSDLGEKNFNVRRPLYGISPKPDQFAYISLYQSQDRKLTPISIRDSSSPAESGGEGMSNANHNFILQNVSFARQEKTQILETFGDHYTFFYGSKPTVMQVSGLLMNTIDFNWKNEWLHNYENYLRGTRCVESRALVYLGFDDVLVSGYILGTSVNHSAQNPYLCPFQFQMLVNNYVDLSDAAPDYVHHGAQSRSMHDTMTSWSDNTYVEYLTAMENSKLYELGDKGNAKPVAGTGTGGEPATLGDSGSKRSAYWVGSATSSNRSRLTASEALMRIDRDATVAQTGKDATTVMLSQVGDNSSDFPLSSPDVTADLSKALSEGVSNKAAVIGSAPIVG